MRIRGSKQVSLAFVLLVAAVGCASDPSDVPAIPTDSAAAELSSRKALAVVDLRDAPQTDEGYPVVEVEAGDNTFGDNAAIRIRPGTEVKWANTGRNDHDVIPLEPAKQFGVGPQAFAPGEEHEFTFDEPGIYEYFCDIHGGKD